MNRVKVLLCEYSTPLHGQLKQGFCEALESVDLLADIVSCEDIDVALSTLGTGEYDMLVTDLSFNRHVATGLQFIRLVKQRHPDLCVVACSAGAPTVDEIRTNQPSFDLFVPKRVILNPGEDDMPQVGQELKSKIKRLSGFGLRLREHSIHDLSVSGDPISEMDLRSLVSQVLANLSDVGEPFRPKEVTLTPISGGYSGSLVVMMSIRAADPNLKYVQSVLKISLAPWARDEIANFKRYAKWMLPSNKRAELVGEGKTYKFGAVAYAVVFGGETQFSNLTEYIEKCDVETVVKYIDIIFDEELINFYNSTRFASELTVGQHYRTRYFPDARYQETIDKFQTVLVSEFGAVKEGIAWRIGKELFPDPFRVIFSGQNKQFSLSICHGDLNSNNIICATNHRVAYIDFQDTGPGHLLQDFAALENSVRLNWGRSAANNLRGSTPVNLLKKERAILAGRKQRAVKNPGYEHLCKHLRQVARTKFPEIQDWEYPFAVAALSLKLMRIQGLSIRQLRRLAACAIVSTQDLEQKML